MLLYSHAHTHKLRIAFTQNRFLKHRASSFKVNKTVFCDMWGYEPKSRWQRSGGSGGLIRLEVTLATRAL